MRDLYSLVKTCLLQIFRGESWFDIWINPIKHTISLIMIIITIINTTIIITIIIIITAIYYQPPPPPPGILRPRGRDDGSV